MSFDSRFNCRISLFWYVWVSLLSWAYLDIYTSSWSIFDPNTFLSLLILYCGSCYYYPAANSCLYPPYTHSRTHIAIWLELVLCMFDICIKIWAPWRHDQNCIFSVSPVSTMPARKNRLSIQYIFKSITEKNSHCIPPRALWWVVLKFFHEP